MKKDEFHRCRYSANVLATYVAATVLQAFGHVTLSIRSPSQTPQAQQRDFERESFQVERVFDVIDCDENRVGRYSAIQQLSSIPVYF